MQKKYIVASFLASALFMAGGVSAELIITAPEVAPAGGVETSLKAEVKVNSEIMETERNDSEKEQVQTKIDAELKNNTQIKSAEVSEETVVVVYAAPAKLFGFIPMTMNMEVEADANAQVKVKFPWYKFMVSSKFSNAATLINGVFQSNQADLNSLKARPAEERQMEIFIKISNSLKAMQGA